MGGGDKVATGRLVRRWRHGAPGSRGALRRSSTCGGRETVIGIPTSELLDPPYHGFAGGRAGGTVVQAAEHVGVSESTVYRWLRAFLLQRGDSLRYGTTDQSSDNTVIWRAPHGVPSPRQFSIRTDRPLGVHQLTIRHSPDLYRLGI